MTTEKITKEKTATKKNNVAVSSDLQRNIDLSIFLDIIKTNENLSEINVSVKKDEINFSIKNFSKELSADNLNDPRPKTKRRFHREVEEDDNDYQDEFKEDELDEELLTEEQLNHVKGIRAYRDYEDSVLNNPDQFMKEDFPVDSEEEDV